jgi:lipid-A-disaccharide synthase-like uncharacterized protein
VIIFTDVDTIMQCKLEAKQCKLEAKQCKLEAKQWKLLQCTDFVLFGFKLSVQRCTTKSKKCSLYWSSLCLFCGGTTM